MSQPQTTPSKPTAQLAQRTVRLDLNGPGARLAETIVAQVAEDTFSGDRAPDSELLRQCALVNEIGAVPPTIDEVAWTRALLRVGYTSPLTLVGLRAKVEIALMLLPFPPVPGGGDRDDAHDRLLWLVLRDVIRMIDRAKT